MDQNTVQLCKQKLLTAKADLLNRLQSHLNDLQTRERGGDEADQTVSLLNENQIFLAQQRVRRQLVEIEAALGRIETGTFGICEETDEPIEPDRLLAIPWTRFSIEGAELRENQKRA